MPLLWSRRKKRKDCCLLLSFLLPEYISLFGLLNKNYEIWWGHAWVLPCCLKYQRGRLETIPRPLGKLPAGYKVPSACPMSYVHSEKNELMYRTSHFVNPKKINLDIYSTWPLTDGLENKLNAYHMAIVKGKR